MKISVILLAGGKGKRMGHPTPKVFLPFKGKPLALHSYDLFSSLPFIQEIVVVCPLKFQHLFPQNTPFAPPGKERQDSVKNGFERTTSPLLLIHDAARPFITEKAVNSLIQEGLSTGAAALATPIKSTIKQVNQEHFVTKTLNRSQLFATQTPQLLTKEVLQKGLEAAQKKHLQLTDDVALAELINHPVKIVCGEESNIKITTPEDLKWENIEFP